MSCWRQKAFPEIITEIRSPLAITRADGVKGTGCRGAGGLRSSWVPAGWGSTGEIGTLLSRNRHGAWAPRGPGGEICLSPWNVLSLSAVYVFVGLPPVWQIWWNAGGNPRVCGALAVFPYGILHLLQPVCKEKPLGAGVP